MSFIVMKGLCLVGVHFIPTRQIQYLDWNCSWFVKSVTQQETEQQILNLSWFLFFLWEVSHFKTYFGAIFRQYHISGFWEHLSFDMNRDLLRCLSILLIALLVFIESILVTQRKSNLMMWDLNTFNYSEYLLCILTRKLVLARPWLVKMVFLGILRHFNIFSWQNIEIKWFRTYLFG